MRRHDAYRNHALAEPLESRQLLSVPGVTGAFIHGHQLMAGDRLAEDVPVLVVAFSEDLVTGGGTGAVDSLANWSLWRSGLDLPSAISSISFGLNVVTGRYEAQLTFAPALSAGTYDLTAKDAIRNHGGSAIDGDSDGVAGGDYHLRFDIVQPQPLSAEYRVSVDKGGEYSAVAADAAGNYVVVWQGDDLDATGVFARRYSAAGEPLSDPWQVNQYTKRNQYEATIAMDADGDFMIAWSSSDQDGDQSGVYARRYNAAGQSLGDEFRVNTTTAGYQRSPGIALQPDGRGLIVWAGFQPASSGAIYGQLLDADGQFVGGEIRVSDVVVRASDPSVIATPGGGYLAAWQSSNGNSQRIYARQLGASGNPVGDQFLVSNPSLGTQYRPSIAMDADGDFLIAWDTRDQDGDFYGVYARRYNAAAQPLCDEFQVNTFTQGAQRWSKAAMNARGDSLIVWYSQYGPDGYAGIYAQRYNAIGQPQGDNFRVNSVGIAESHPSALMTAQGDFAIFWRGGIAPVSYALAGRVFGDPAPTADIVDVLPDPRSRPVDQIRIVFSEPVIEFDLADLSLTRDGGGNLLTSEQALSTADHTTFVLANLSSLTAPAGNYSLILSASSSQITDFRSNPMSQDVADAWTTLPTPQILSASTDTQTVLSGTCFSQALPAITVTFSEPMVTGDRSDSATNHRNWALVRNGIDISSLISSIALAHNPSTGAYDAQIAFAAVLDDGAYELTARDAIRGEAGVPLDGDADGSAGGYYSLAFSIVQARPLTDEMHLDSSASASDWISNLSVGSDAHGNYVVVWKANVQGIRARRYNAAGEPLGAEFAVNSVTTSGLASPRVDMNSAGDFVVAWAANHDGNGLGVYVRVFSADGQPKGNAILVNTYTQNAQKSPVVAIGPDGSFVVVWESDGQDGGGLGIHGQRFDGAGQRLGKEFGINTFTVGSQSTPAVAMAHDGSFIVAWQSEQQDGSSLGIYAQRYDAAGQPLGGEVQVNTYTFSAQANPSVAVDERGGFVIAWDSYREGVASKSVYAQRYDASGQPLGEEFPVNVNRPAAYPAIAMSPDGDFIVTSLSGGAIGQRFNASGEPVGDVFRISSGMAYGTLADVTMIGAEGYVVVWAGARTGFWHSAFARIYRPFRREDVVIEAGSEVNQFWLARVNNDAAVYLADPTAGPPAHSGPTAELTRYLLVGDEFDDSFIVDLANGNPLPAAGASFDGGLGENVVRIIGCQPDTSLVVADQQFLLGTIPVTVDRATIRLDGTGPILLRSLGVTGSATLSGGGDIRTENLLVGERARLELDGGELLIRNGTLAEVVDWVRRGWNGGDWRGPGIVKAAGSNLHSGLGVYINDLGDGKKIRLGEPSDAVLVKYTWLGDANLDGLVNADDYFNIDSGFISQKPGWFHGDFNYDSAINADDYFLIDSAYIAQTGPLATTTPATNQPRPADPPAAPSPIPPTASSPFARRLLEDLLPDPDHPPFA